MPALDAELLTRDVTQAMLTALGLHAREASLYVQSEAVKLAETALLIEAGVREGDINEAQATILVSMQEGASRAVLTSIKTIGAIAAQDAINAGLRVLLVALKTTVGIAIP
jgi:tryptophanyl-tRNA synthetase